MIWRPKKKDHHLPRLTRKGRRNLPLPVEEREKTPWVNGTARKGLAPTEEPQMEGSSELFRKKKKTRRRQEKSEKKESRTCKQQGKGVGGANFDFFSRVGWRVPREGRAEAPVSGGGGN